MCLYVFYFLSVPFLYLVYLTHFIIFHHSLAYQKYQCLQLYIYGYTAAFYLPFY